MKLGVKTENEIENWKEHLNSAKPMWRAQST